MDKEKILNLAQKEKKADEYENKERKRSSILGLISVIVVGILFIVIEFLFENNISPEIVAMCMAPMGVQLLYEGIKFKKWYLIAVSILFVLITIFCIFVFCSKVVLL